MEKEIELEQEAIVVYSGGGAVNSVNGYTGDVVLTTSDLENTSDYQTGTEVESAINTAIAGKQDTLTAGNNITISNNTISATDTTYSAGTGLTLDGTQFSVNTETIATQQDVSNEATARENADTNLQGQIDAISASSDVTDIVGTYADLQAYDTTRLKDNDIIKVLQDESQNDETTYYRWSTSTQTFTLIGEEGPYYTKSQTDTLLQAKQNALTAGSNITIGSDNTISATDTTYTAGTNVSISSGNVISATDTTYSNFVGTDGTAAGTAGLVPAPATTDAGKFLKADGTWDTAGGGGPTVVQTTGTSTTDVMSQNAVTSMVFADPATQYKIKIGAGTSATEGNDAVEIGHNAAATKVNSTALGAGASATGNRSTAIGQASYAQSDNSLAVGGGGVRTSSPYAMAIGYAADVRTNAQGAIAIGDYALATMKGQFDISTLEDGTSSTRGYNNSPYRLLTGLYDGQSAHDAATKGQLDSIAIQNAGAPTTATVGTVGQLLEDTTNGKLYICTDTTGGTYTWEEVGAGGGGGPSNYNELNNKPSINDVSLQGNKSLSDLGAQATLVSGTNIKTINNQSILGSGNITIEGGETEDYTPYIFDYDFKTGVYEPLSGITEVTGGVTVTNGFANKVVINKYISAEDCSYYADVTLADTNTVLCLSSVESNGGIHSSIVTFDFANSVISVYPKSNGSSIPATPYDTLSLTNVSGLSYKIEVGRKNRDFYARLTNRTTGKVEEIVIGDESEGAAAYKYPVGWLHDYVAFSQISGNSTIWERVYSALPKRDVVFLGDSITEGYGVSWKKTWVTLVADEIGHDKVLNMGSSGDQIRQCQSITDTVLTILKPKVVVVTIGTNGGNTDANVKALYDSIVNLGAYPIFNYIYRGNNSVSANACIAKLKCEGARFDYETSIDYDLSKEKNSNYFQTDGLHLNDTGNEAVAQRFLNDCSWIKEFIEKEEQGGDVSEDVAQLKLDMTNVLSELEMESPTEIQKSTFYAGRAINGLNGSEVPSPAWASNREYIQAKKVRCTDPTYNFVGRYYNTSTGGYNSGTPDGVRYTELDIPNDFYVKISVKRVDGADMTSADATAISNAIEFIIIDAGSMISMRLKDIEDRLTALENQ